MDSFEDIYTLRPYEPDDEQGVLELWQAAFNKKLDRNLFRWKYPNNPFEKNMLLCVAADGTVVSYYGGIPYPTNLDGETVAMVQLMDIMTHPDYRIDKVFARTGKRFMGSYCGPSGSIMMYGFPGKFHFDVGGRKLGYRQVGELSYLVASSAELAGRRTSLSCLGHRVRRTEEVGGDFDELWSALRSDYPLSVIRDASFVRWRFADHPHHTYQIWRHENFLGSRCFGYAVVRIIGAKATIVDLLTPNSRSFVTVLLKVLARKMAALGIDEIETWLPAGHFNTRFAEEAGFSVRPEPLEIIPTIRPFEHSPPIDEIEAKLYYTMADADLF